MEDLAGAPLWRLPFAIAADFVSGLHDGWQNRVNAYSRTCLNEDNGDQKLLFVKAGYQFRHIPWYTGTWLGPEIFSQLEVIRLVGISLGIFYCIMQAKYFVF